MSYLITTSFSNKVNGRACYHDTDGGTATSFTVVHGSQDDAIAKAGELADLNPGLSFVVEDPTRDWEVVHTTERGAS